MGTGEFNPGGGGSHASVPVHGSILPADLERSTSALRTNPIKEEPLRTNPIKEERRQEVYGMLEASMGVDGRRWASQASAPPTATRTPTAATVAWPSSIRQPQNPGRRMTSVMAGCG